MLTKICAFLPFFSLLFGHAGLSPAAPAGAQTDLNFQIQSGQIANYFFRHGSVAAHLSLRSGPRPRVIAAFPAGNSGAGIWFDHSTQGVLFSTEAGPQPVVQEHQHGIAVIIHTDAPKLTSNHLILGGIRFLRQYEDDGVLPPELLGELSATPTGAVVRRKSFDQVHDYALYLSPRPGTKLEVDAKNHTVALERLAGSSELSFEMTALTSEKPLTPIPWAKLFKKVPTAPDDLQNALAFLSYEEKLLAGSWRFLTYFGRDTLLSAYLLQPVLGPAVLEAALASVLERLAADGRVAHEEDIGDWAAYLHATQDKAAAPEQGPIYNYKMVDADFLLAPVAAAYLLAPSTDPLRAQEFLQRKTSAGLSYKEALLTNLRLVLAQASPYAAQPTFDQLIRLRRGEVVGDWRDSSEGLGGGVYPYSVNVSFVPAAIEASERLTQSALLRDEAGAATLALEQRLATAWRGVGQHFQVAVGPDDANAELTAFQRHLGLSSSGEARIDGRSFHGLALTQKGQPIAVMHTDDGFSLLFNEPTPAELTEAIAAVCQPFPAGLLTPVGLVVANPAFAAAQETWNLFTSNHYHGTVVWSWQQAVYLAGLRRQALRTDIALGLRRNLLTAADRLAAVIALAPSSGREELWTFRIDNGVYHATPFGADPEHRTESNPIQLWSTVFLGMRSDEVLH